MSVKTQFINKKKTLVADRTKFSLVIDMHANAYANIYNFAKVNIGLLNSFNIFGFENSFLYVFDRQVFDRQDSAVR
jgi:hypothetical protein